MHPYEPNQIKIEDHDIHSNHVELPTLKQESDIYIFDEFHDLIQADEPHFACDESPTDLSPFESIEIPNSSISSNQEVPEMKHLHYPTDSVDYNTVFQLKRAMADTSRLISTFTALKTTYLKLCKEFNFLLRKFNDNEKMKIDLIHENNQLRELLVETITQKELDRKKYKADLDKLRRGR